MRATTSRGENGLQRRNRRRPSSKPEDAIDLVGTRRHHDDRHRAFFAPQRARDVVAVHAGQPDVENEQIGPAARAAQRRVTVRDADDRETFTLEMMRQQFANRRIIFSNEDRFAPACRDECPRSASMRARVENSRTSRTRLTCFAGERAELRAPRARAGCDRSSRRGIRGVPGDVPPTDTLSSGLFSHSRSKAATQREPSSASSDATASAAASPSIPLRISSPTSRSLPTALRLPSTYSRA